VAGAARLYQATRDDTEYIFGDSVTSLDQDHDGVHVTFSRAAPRTFALVITATAITIPDYDQVPRPGPVTPSADRAAGVADSPPDMPPATMDG
jgi:hypothetical protein